MLPCCDGEIKLYIYYNHSVNDCHYSVTHLWLQPVLTVYCVRDLITVAVWEWTKCCCWILVHAEWTTRHRGRVRRTSQTSITPKNLMTECSSCATHRPNLASIRALRNSTTRQCQLAFSYCSHSQNSIVSNRKPAGGLVLTFDGNDRLKENIRHTNKGGLKSKLLLFTQQVIQKVSIKLGFIRFVRLRK